MKTNAKLLAPIMALLMIAGSTASLAAPKSDSGKSKTQKSKKVKTKKKVKKLSKDEKKGKIVFQTHCAACHRGGRNVVKPSRPVIGSSTLATFATFKANLNKPLGNMPHYEHLIEDDKMLKKLYKYTKALERDSEQASSDKKGKTSKTEKKKCK